MEITQTDINDVKVIALDGKIIYETETKVKELFEDLFANGKTRIVLNLEKLTYVNSSGLGMLIALLKKSRSIGGDIRPCCMNKDIFELFKVTSLDHVFKIAPTEEDALNSFY